MSPRRPFLQRSAVLVCSVPVASGDATAPDKVLNLYLARHCQTGEALSGGLVGAVDRQWRRRQDQPCR